MWRSLTKVSTAIYGTSEIRCDGVGVGGGARAAFVEARAVVRKARSDGVFVSLFPRLCNKVAECRQRHQLPLSK